MKGFARLVQADSTRVALRARAAVNTAFGRCALLAAGFAAALVATEAMAVFVVTEPWVRLSADARSAEAYMELSSTEAATLVDVRCDMAKKIAIRSPGKSRVLVRSIVLPAGQKVALAPRGERLSLSGLDRTLHLGDHLAMVLVVAGADGTRREIPVNAEVRLHSPTDDHLHGHAH